MTSTGFRKVWPSGPASKPWPSGVPAADGGATPLNVMRVDPASAPGGTTSRAPDVCVIVPPSGPIRCVMGASVTGIGPSSAERGFEDEDEEQASTRAARTSHQEKVRASE